MTLSAQPNLVSFRPRLIEDCQRLGDMLGQFAKQDSDISKVIHTIRKLGKSLRGGCALVGLQDTASRQIQAIGRLFSTARDAESRRNTWNKLDWSESPETAAAIAALLEKQTACERPPPETIDWCASRAREASAVIEKIDEEGLSETAGARLAKLRKRMKKCCQCLATGAGRDFHETRKSVKAFVGAVDYLDDEHTADDALARLADLLGDENDLATLAVWLETNGFTPRLEPHLWKHLRKRIEKTRREATKCAKKLFA